MTSHLKTQVSSSDFEAETISPPSKRALIFRLLDATREALTLCSLAFGIVILGVSANALMVYNDTHLGEEFNLPLWPLAMNLNPLVSMVAAGSVIVASKAVVLLVSKVSALRSSAALTTATNLLAPAACFIVALVALAFHFVVAASEEVDTLESWSCRWRNTVMLQQPHFGTLCRQSKAGIGMIIALVPLELLIAFVALVQVVLARGLRGHVDGRRKSPSPH